MFDQPQEQHRWLENFVGQWTYEATCQMPDQPSSTMRGAATARMLGGLWLIIESAGECPEAGPWKSELALGYDPKSGKYQGTFIGSMMSHLWLYNGALDGANKLVLDTSGPKCDQTPGVGVYQDIVELVDKDHWILRSQIQTDSGAWQPFMTSHHRRAH